MKIQEVILRAMSKQITVEKVLELYRDKYFDFNVWIQAAEIIGVSPRTMRRWRHRYEKYGYDGLYDR